MAGLWNSEGGNRALGARDSATTGRCVAPARGVYNPIGTEQTIQCGRGGLNGGTTTPGAGAHPSEGALQPLGTLAHLHPLCTTRDGERAGPRAWYPV